ncbi:hypothetical protein BSZ18_21915 [Bradyrhizobium canariense]|uniref:Uncharacterized protein n=1 Tax=Bradyrhizobium canariense TaxID=255045 RepID=A0A1X3GNB5_9BRAD|nr:hypothetical protein BSZ25_18310 [Bradyrhizobium canariense]OSI93533.1 hypothetical protein BSZ24_12590 [Bradyrhizobium canariense]OSJ03511.1 hypothetical protein BSZ16_15570 [Bradyrhizobium canariense]OSJ06749.1 hypothetical protein BSZ18_21915 [Bradyrhizobium canariense]
MRISGFAIELASIRRIHDRMLFGARLILWPLIVLTLVSLALQLGGWQSEFNVSGPFAEETNPPRASLVLELPADGLARWWRQPLIGDDGGNLSKSSLKLRINGREMGPPHTLHETIRTGHTTGFSHWGRQIIFALPPDIKNGPETTATLRYKVRPRIWVTSALAVLSTLLGYFVCSGPLRAVTERCGEPIRAGVLKVPYVILSGLCWAGLVASAVYILSSLYALVTGWALPTTALIHWSSVTEWAASNEPYFGYPLLMLAGLGTVTTWLVGSNPFHQGAIESNEQSLRRLLAWCGFPITACALVLCMSAIWAGLVRPGDPNATNIGGLLPFLDGGNYLAAAFDQVKDGVWNAPALRRPLAAAFRSVLLFLGNSSVQLMLILQACLVAGAACFATHAIAAWRGVWASVAFLGLTYIYSRYFVPTALTEPFGLFWALLSIPFFIKAFRDHSVNAALVAFAMTTVALTTRMGSMFTIPALAVWLVWQFGKGPAAKIRTGTIAICILLSVFVLNSLLQRAYARGPSPSTGNFAYVLCGLSIGTTWDGCVKKLAAEGTPIEGSEDDRTRQLYSAAWRNFRAQPGTFIRRLTDSAQAFATQFPEVIWRGYGRINAPDWLLRNVLTAMALTGFLYGAARRANAVELTFWTLLWASIVVSSSLIYFDDGARSLAASHPMMALFFALGMSNLAQLPAKSTSRSQLARNGFVGLIAAAMLFVCVPWIAHRFSPISALVSAIPLPKPNETFVFGGHRMSGFLVVEDNQPLRDDVPSLHLADFDAIITQSGVEQYQELVHPMLPPLPFGFVFAPRVESGSNSGLLYIVPAEVVEHREVPVWHFDLKRWREKPDFERWFDKQDDSDDYWIYVTKAEPWQPLDPK